MNKIRVDLQLKRLTLPSLSKLSGVKTKMTALVLLLLHVISAVGADQNNNPFDIGESRACVQPRDLNVCNFLDYQVPASVAHHRMAAIRQGLVNNTNTEGETTQCKSAITKIQCQKHFPRCVASEGRVTVDYSAETCNQVSDVCTEMIMEQGSCDFTVNASLGMCKSVSQFVAETQRPLTACNNTAAGDSNWYVTEWMFEYLSNIDEELNSFANGIESLFDSVCLEKYFSFRCRSIGRCWDQGKRIEFHPLNTMSNCQEILTCASTAIRSSLSNQLVCHLWPDLQPPATPTTPITQQTTSSPSSVTSDMTTTSDDQIGQSSPTSGTLSLHSKLGSVLSVTIFVVMVGSLIL